MTSFLLLAQVLVSGPWVFILGTALTVVLALAAVALSHLGAKLHLQTEDQRKILLLDMVDEFAEAAVARIGATLKREYTRLTADKSLSVEDAKALADAAVKEIRELMTETGVARMQKAFGWGPAEMDKKLRGVVEEKVNEAKELNP